VSDPPLVRVSELRLEALGKRHGSSWAVRDVSISVHPGELYTLLGPSGCGKSTLLRLVAGLIAPDAGRVVIDDEVVDAVPASRRNIGMVFSNGALWPHLSAFDNVALALRAGGRPAGEIQRRVESALARAGLQQVGPQKPAVLSPEDQRRLALARALAVEPRLLLLDEPLADLEPGPRARMRLDLARIHREAGITTIHATRDQANALALSSRIAVLCDGRVVQEGRPEEIYWQPRSRFVAEFVGAANLVSVRVVELREVGVVVEVPGGARLPVSSGGRAWKVGARGLLCLRPEALRVEEAALAPGGIPGRVLSQVFEGARLSYEVDISGAALRVEMVTSALMARALQPGDHVRVEVSPETSVLLPDEPSSTSP
jgi:putative spermidine/putrescine transport system ATP-binding protein